MSALVAPNVIHGAVECSDVQNSDSECRKRKLWRIDDLRGEKYLLVLSENKVDFSEVARQFGYDSDFEQKNYDTLLNRIKTGSKWRFKIKANPTVKKYDPDTGKKKVLAHITPLHQEEWLRNQSAKNGFYLSDGEWLVTESKWYIFKKNKASKEKVKLLSVTYEGMLTVSDEEMFKNALVSGIGREKAYGMGLLTVAGV